MGLDFDLGPLRWAQSASVNIKDAGALALAHDNLFPTVYTDRPELPTPDDVNRTLPVRLPI